MKYEYMFLLLVSLQVTTLKNALSMLTMNASRLKRNVPITSSSSEDYIFSLPDIITDFKNDKGQKIKLEAFKTRNNDVIINGNSQDKYGQLQWVSLGHPKLLIGTNGQYFEFNHQHLHAKISMLTDEHISLLKHKIQSKYRQLKSEGSIENNQIVDMPLSEFKCKLKVECSEKEIALIGHVKNYKEFPLTLYFSMDKFKKFKMCIERHLFNETLEHLLECQVAQKVKLGKRNALIIGADHETKLDLVNEIFGTSEFKYVTRDQLDQVSTRLMSDLGIYEEFEFDDEIDDTYIRDEILKQTALETFKSVPINEALDLLSPFSINEDIRPDVIVSEMSKILKVTKIGNKEHIIVDNESYSKDMQRQAGKFGIKIKGGFKLLNVGGTIKMAKQNEILNEKQEKSLMEQLSEINNAETSDVFFEQKGERIVPKSIIVAKLSKAQFNKKLTFSKIKQKLEVTRFLEKFPLVASVRNESSSTINCRKIANLARE
jgi:hypothetical protein